MNNDIFSLIDAAKEQMKQIGLADATIETYQQRSFNQIIQRYQKVQLINVNRKWKKIFLKKG